MVDISHSNGTVLTGVPEDGVEHYVEHGWSVVESDDVKAAPAVKASEKAKSDEPKAPVRSK